MIMASLNGLDVYPFASAGAEVTLFYTDSALGN